MTTLEGDFRRMISNAKSFNDKKSQVFSDSEKIRKILSRTMEERNPAYRTPDYQAYTTPVPDDWKEKLEQKAAEDMDAEGDDDPHAVVDSKSPVKRTRLVTHVGSSSAVNDRRASSTPAVQDTEGAFQGLEGNTFQEAQEKIMTELMHYRDDPYVHRHDRALLLLTVYRSDEDPVFGPFIPFPPRSNVEYYKIIKNPVSLKSVQKFVRGIRGRDKPTGATFFKSWAAFEEEVSKIWGNARVYNEDGSPIFELAGKLEEYFQRRLAEAKRVVAEPPQPRVKLRMPAKSPEPSKITLKFGGHKGAGTPAMSVDNEALKRQQDLVRAGADGHATASGPTSTPSLGRSFIERGVSTGHPVGLKAEASCGQSPALNAIQLNGAAETRQSPGASQVHMPPPIGLSSRLPSGSPHPQTVANCVGTASNSSATPFNSRFRQPGKGEDKTLFMLRSLLIHLGISDALITNLNIRSHDGLKIKDHLSLDIPASASRTQQSVTITIPSTHDFLKITPTLSSSIMHRPSKTVVSCSTLSNPRLQPLPQRGDPDIRRPVYETRVLPGVSAIDVEVIAGPPRGAPKVGSGQEIEFEKITLLVHLQKT